MWVGVSLRDLWNKSDSIFTYTCWPTHSGTASFSAPENFHKLTAVIESSTPFYLLYAWRHYCICLSLVSAQCPQLTTCDRGRGLMILITRRLLMCLCLLLHTEVWGHAARYKYNHVSLFAAHANRRPTSHCHKSTLLFSAIVNQELG